MRTEIVTYENFEKSLKAVSLGKALMIAGHRDRQIVITGDQIAKEEDVIRKDEDGRGFRVKSSRGGLYVGRNRLWLEFS